MRNKNYLMNSYRYVPSVIPPSFIISQLDVLEHDANNTNFNSLVMIDETHFILAYTGGGNNGFISTFSIDGSFNITEIASLEHEATTFTSYNSLVKIDDTHFILAYAGGDNDGFIKTFSIDGSFNITEIDVIEHDTSDSIWNSLSKIDDTHFILAYAGVGGDGFIKTFSIDGSFIISQIDVLEHDTASGLYNSLVKIDSTHFILAYATASNDGKLKTFSIDGSFNITEIASLEHDLFNGTHNSLDKIDSTHFALGYVGVDGGDVGLLIKTFSIDGSFNITEIDELFADTNVNVGWTSLQVIDSQHLCVAYAGLSDDGFIKTFSIDGSFSNITEIDSLEHDTVNGQYNSLVKIDESHVILAYRGSGLDGFIKTFTLDA